MKTRHVEGRKGKALWVTLPHTGGRLMSRTSFCLGWFGPSEQRYWGLGSWNSSHLSLLVLEAESQDGSSGRSKLWWGCTFWLIDSHLLLTPSRSERGLISSMFFLIKALIPFMGFNHPDLITLPPGTHIQTLSHCRSGFRHINWRRHKHSVHQQFKNHKVNLTREFRSWIQFGQSRKSRTSLQYLDCAAVVTLRSRCCSICEC